MAKNWDDDEDKETRKKREAAEKAEREAAEKEAKSRSTRETEPAPIVGPTDFLTEQEKSTTPDPVSPPVEPEKAVVLDIPAKQPYPTGGAA